MTHSLESRFRVQAFEAMDSGCLCNMKRFLVGFLLGSEDLVRVFIEAKYSFIFVYIFHIHSCATVREKIR
jgi:hypothetical protein